MAEKDTDKIDPTKPITAQALMELLTGGKGKPQMGGVVQIVITALLVLGGTGVGQSFFGVSKDSFQQETAAIKTQNAELLKELGSMKERIVRLETKIEQGGK